MLGIMKLQEQLKNIPDTSSLLNTQEQMKALQMKRLQDISPLFSSIYQSHKQIKNLEINPLHNIHEQMKKLQELHCQFNSISQIKEKILDTYRFNTSQEQIKLLQDSYRSFEKAIGFPELDVHKVKTLQAMSQSFGSAFQAEKQIKASFAMPHLFNSASQLEKLRRQSFEISQLVSPISQFAKLRKESLGMSQLFNSISQFEKRTKESFDISQIFNIISQTQELKKILDSTVEFQYLTQNKVGFDVNEDGMFCIGNEAIAQEKISEYFNVDSINDFITQLKDLSNPAIKAVLIYLVIPYFIAIFANLTTLYWEEQKEFFNIKPREVKKEIISSAKENYNFQYLQEYRFVSTKILYVHDDKSTKADVIDELYLGKMVKFIDKTKSWCLIEYQDDDTNELKQGWVFSRYLSKFIQQNTERKLQQSNIDTSQQDKKLITNLSTPVLEAFNASLTEFDELYQELAK